MLKDQLKEHAKTVIHIPSHFRAAIEEYVERENGEGEAMYSWTDEQQEEMISLTLDFAGNLTNLTIDLNKNNLNKTALTEKQLKENSDQFLSNQYPHALEALTCGQTKKLTDGYRFNYEQTVMDLPLAHAGCFIDVAFSGEIVNFKYYGLKPKPVIPKLLIAKEKLIEDVENRLDFQLTIMDLDTAICDVDEDGLHLVYEIAPYFMRYKAGVLEPMLTVTHEEDEGNQEIYASLPSPTIEIKKSLSNEEIIGITQEMEIIREVELEKETGIVWRERGWVRKENDLSIHNFFQTRSEDTVKAFISNRTGKVKRFIWFKERSGTLSLNRKECYQKAIDFLQMVIPNYTQLLQLVVHADNEPDDTSAQEAFAFRVHSRQGTPVYLERVLIAVNRLTGQINHYSGLNFDLDELQQLPAEPTISKKEAHGIFLRHLEFELAWNENYEEQEEGDTLSYEACDQYTRKSIRYIDALTGAVITAKE